MLASSLVFAAETKKVAILDILDTENVLESGQKLMIRSSLEKAIAKKHGYEAFDRSNLDQIMEEHNFQRTGFVNKKEIKELGAMTGADYILISEAAKNSDRKIVVAVKLVNVETAKVEMSESKVMGTSSNDMQEGCDELANALFGTKKNSVNPLLKDAPAGSKELLTRVGLTQYVYAGSKMKPKEYEQFLLRRCSPAYKQYHNGKYMTYFGYGAFGVGALAIGIGAALLPSAKQGVHTAGVALVSVGSVSAAAGVTLFTFGVLKKRQSVKTFNTQCLSDNLEFRLNAGQNGIGLAMTF